MHAISGKCFLALPLQHWNWEWFDIFEIGVSERRVGKEVIFK